MEKSAFLIIVCALIAGNVVSGKQCFCDKRNCDDALMCTGQWCLVGFKGDVQLDQKCGTHTNESLTGCTENWNGWKEVCACQEDYCNTFAYLRQEMERKKPQARNDDESHGMQHPPVADIDSMKKQASKKKVPIYNINLDLPPEQRWTQVIKENKKIMVGFVQQLRSAQGGSYFRKFGGWLVSKTLEYIASYTWNEEYWRELEGIAKISGIKKGDLALANMFGDLFLGSPLKYVAVSIMGCSTFVAQDKQGQIWLGRNMDIGMTEFFRNNVIFVKFFKNNKFLFSMITWPGYIGSGGQGLRAGAFALTHNTRMSQANTKRFLTDVFASKMANPSPLAMRYALEHINTYEEAVEHLKNVPLITDAYLTLAGTKPGEGVIITREALKTVHVWQLRNGLPEENPWFIFQTNEDSTIPPRYRRRTGNEAMGRMGQANIGKDTIMTVLSTYPVLNDITVFSHVIKVDEPDLFYESLVVRHDSTVSSRRQSRPGPGHRPAAQINLFET